jgi:signal peptidase I
MLFKATSFLGSTLALAGIVTGQFYNKDISAKESLLSAEDCLVLLEDGLGKLRAGETVPKVSELVKQQCRKLLNTPVPSDTPLPTVSRCIITMQIMLRDGLASTLANLSSVEEKELQPLARCGEVISSYYILSESMLPILQINDRIIVDRLIYKTQLPKRKEIVVFRATSNMKKYGIKEILLKRIIGLPGDTVRISKDIVYVNNKPLKKLYSMSRSLNDYGPITVPMENYFVLGDNYNNSFDSRIWGFLPHSSIVGKVVWRYFPLNREGAL